MHMGGGGWLRWLVELSVGLGWVMGGGSTDCGCWLVGYGFDGGGKVRGKKHDEMRKKEGMRERGRGGEGRGKEDVECECMMYNMVYVH